MSGAMEYRGCRIYCDTDGLAPRWRFAGGGVLPEGQTFGDADTKEGCRRRIDWIIRAHEINGIKAAITDIEAGRGQAAVERLRALLAADDAERERARAVAEQERDRNERRRQGLW